MSSASGVARRQVAGTSDGAKRLSPHMYCRLSREAHLPAVPPVATEYRMERDRGQALEVNGKGE